MKTRALAVLCLLLAASLAGCSKQTEKDLAEIRAKQDEILAKLDLDRRRPEEARRGARPPARRPRTSTRSTRSPIEDSPVRGDPSGAGHDRRVLRLPVPVLRARGAADRGGAEEVPEGRALRVQAVPAAHAPGGAPRGALVARRAGAGEVLGDARRADPEPADPRRQQGRGVRQAGRPRREEVQGRPREEQARSTTSASTPTCSSARASTCAARRRSSSAARRCACAPSRA